jgi:Clostripain family
MKKKSWTVMTYLAGDNNLDSAGVTDLGEMKKVGSTNNLNLVAQFDRRAASRQTRRYFLKKGTSLEEDAVQNLGETNTGDPKVLSDFVQWSAKNYPADRYMLVVWNHGNGWDDEDVYRLARRNVGANITRRGSVVDRAPKDKNIDVSMRRLRVIAGDKFRRSLFSSSINAALRTRGIAYDDNAKDFLDNLELKGVLLTAKKAIGRNLDVLGLDACLMSMAEVGFENRVAVDFTAGSEQTEPGDGWPYNTILNDLAKNPKMSARELASTVVKRYVGSYGSSSGVTQAACDLAESAALLKTVNGLADVLRKALGDPIARAGVILSRTQAQSYDTKDYVDLQDLCELLLTNCAANKTITAAARAVIAAIKKYVIANGAKGSEVANSHGVSIHFPNDPRQQLSPLYARLDWAKEGRWDEFLTAWLASLRNRSASSVRRNLRGGYR